MKGYFNTVVIAEWLTFFAAILLLNKKTGVWRLFTLFLLASITVETTGWYLHAYRSITQNGLPFNLLTMIGTCFFLWLLRANASTRMQKWVSISIVFFLAAGVYNLLFGQGLWQYNSYSELLGNILIALLCCYLLYRIVTGPPVARLASVDYFWLMIGLLFSSLGATLVYAFQQTLYQYYLDTHFNIGGYILNANSLIFYTTLIIAFFCRWKTTKSLSG